MPEVKFRVDDDTKVRFDEACKSRGLTNSNVLREAIYKFISESEPKPLVSIQITRPDNYDYGAWLVEATLLDKKNLAMKQNIRFQLPKLRDRHIMVDQDYLTLFNSDGGYEIGGLLKKGHWKSHCYSNGCAEDDNRTPIAEIKLKLEAAIDRAIREYIGQA